MIAEVILNNAAEVILIVEVIQAGVALIAVGAAMGETGKEVTTIFGMATGPVKVAMRTILRVDENVSNATHQSVNTASENGIMMMADIMIVVMGAKEVVLDMGAKQEVLGPKQVVLDMGAVVVMMVDMGAEQVVLMQINTQPQLQANGDHNFRVSFRSKAVWNSVLGMDELPVRKRSRGELSFNV